MSRRQQLPDGFRYGDQVPPEHYQPPPPPARRRRTSGPPPELNCLSDALTMFRTRMPVTKKEDVKLANARVGVLYVHTGNAKTYLVMFKRELYRNFARHFPEVPEEERAEGVLCNMKLVGWAATQSIELVAIFADGRAYSMPALEFWDYYGKYGTDVKHAPGEIATPISRWSRVF